MKGIESIELVFENCECMKFSSTDILYFDMSGHDKRINNYSNAITISNYIKSFEIAIKKDAKPIDWFSSHEPDCSRLTGRDITQIEIKCVDGSLELFVVEWPDGDNQYHHDNQHYKTTPAGHHYITSTVLEVNSFVGEEVVDFNANFGRI